jgi:hypothetical protein
MDERYREKRRAIEQLFVAENRVADSTRTSVSQSGDFRLETCRYSIGPKTWAYSRGVVTRIADGEIIADVKRNLGHFWHAWVQHANGSEYLLCGEDYQGYSVINLRAGTCKILFPEHGHVGWGFCWGAVFPSPDTLILAVDGCYWGCPYNVVFYDFRDPETFPFRELDRVDHIVDQCEGWTDNETFVLKREVEFRMSHGAPYVSLGKAEQAALDADDSLVDFRTETQLL